MEDYSKHRLLEGEDDLQQFISVKGKEFVETYKLMVFARLRRMKTGDALKYHKFVKIENIPLFIKCCCLFIMDNRDYEFTVDWTKIRRISDERPKIIYKEGI